MVIQQCRLPGVAEMSMNFNRSGEAFVGKRERRLPELAAGHISGENRRWHLEQFEVVEAMRLRPCRC